MAQHDGDGLLRLMILAALAKADRPMDGEELAARIAAMIGMPGSGRMAYAGGSSGAAPAMMNSVATNELQRQQTLAKAKVAEAEGDAQATLVKAKAQAEANKLLQESLTALLIQNKAIERWNGTLPQFTSGGAVPFLNLRDLGGVSGEGHSTVAGH